MSLITKHEANRDGSKILRVFHRTRNGVYAWVHDVGRRHPERPCECKLVEDKR